MEEETNKLENTRSEKQALTKFTFYKPFYDVVEKEDEETTARIIMAICKEMFEDGNVEEKLQDQERIVWCGIKEIVLVSKEKEIEGKKLDKYKNLWKHFIFSKTFYDTMKLLDLSDAGKYIKAIMTKAFTNRDPKNLDGRLNTYYNLAKITLDLSKKRSSIGKKGGEKKKTIKPDSIKTVKIMTQEDFVKLNPQIENTILYLKQQEKAKSIDWEKLNKTFKSDNNYKDVKDLYILVNNYEEIIANSYN